MLVVRRLQWFLSDERASLNDIALAIRNISLTPSVILIISKLTNINSGIRVCDVALEPDA
jgi:hypothetical protein